MKSRGDKQRRNRPGRPRLGNQRRGSALTTALIIIVLVSVTLTQMSTSISANALIQDRRRDGSRALAAAEAGIALTLDFFARPQRFDPNDVAFGSNPFVHHPDDSGDYSPMELLLAGEDLVIDPAFYPPMLYGEEGRVSATIDDVRLTAPPVGSPPETLAVVRSVATSSRHNVRRVVEVLIRPPRTFSVEAPAAIMSFRDAGFSGNMTVHWGEAWSKGDFGPMANPNFYNTTDGPTKAFRSEGNLKFQSAGQWGISNAVQNSATITDVAPESSKAAIRADFAGRLYQNATGLAWPEYEYQALKDIARQFGHYYSTDASGKIYRDGLETPENEVAFTEIINNSPTDPPKFVFIDTIDGNEPAADFSNLADVSLSGGGTDKYMHGFYYLGFNLDMAGIGNSGHNITVTVPDQPEDWASGVSWPSGDDTIDVISNGITVVAGEMRVTGNPGFYGSLTAFGDISGGGTPNVYYNPDLLDGLDFPLLSRVEAFQWRSSGAPSFHP